MEKKKVEITELYKLCNKHQLFTCGTVGQYEKMFELAGNGITKAELANILYICSDYRLDVIHGWLDALFGEKYKEPRIVPLCIECINKLLIFEPSFTFGKNILIKPLNNDDAECENCKCELHDERKGEVK